MSEVKPITPQEASNEAKIPDFVIIGINNAIKNNFIKSGFRITQDEIISEIQKISDTERNTIFDKHWLDIEELYKDYGWIVTYESPDRDENFKPYFQFKPLQF